ncbi:MAG: hypothetical protein LAT84_08070 [Balneolia bacterium]|nr:hypothetical protein [Balneolia bacterium]
MEPRENNPFFEHAAITGAGLAVLASLFFYASLLLVSESIAIVLVACLGCCGLTLAPGLVTTWSHVKKFGQTIEVGRGALIGFVSGLVFGVVFNFMDVIWTLFSVNANELFLNALIEFVEQYGDDSALQDIQEQAAGADSGFSVGGLILSMIVIGTLNLITGMVGSAVFKGKGADTIEI